MFWSWQGLPPCSFSSASGACALTDRPVAVQSSGGSVERRFSFWIGARAIAQYASSAFQYLLPDTLGSVRQPSRSATHERGVEQRPSVNPANHHSQFHLHLSFPREG